MLAVKTYYAYRSRLIAGWSCSYSDTSVEHNGKHDGQPGQRTPGRLDFVSHLSLPRTTLQLCQDRMLCIRSIPQFCQLVCRSCAPGAPVAIGWKIPLPIPPTNESCTAIDHAWQISCRLDPASACSSFSAAKRGIAILDSSLFLTTVMLPHGRVPIASLLEGLCLALCEFEPYTVILEL